MMGTKTQHSSSFSRFSRFGKGLQSHSASPHLRGGYGADDDYIPYNGPYEEPPRRRKERDSWGDPIYGEEDDDLVYAGRELHKRYGHNPDSSGWRHDGDRADDRKARPRARTQSGVSGRTVSSGTVDPGRVSIGTIPRNSLHTPAAVRPAVPSYIHLDAAGGVGESPVPTQRASKDGGGTKRGSLASIFTFGGPSRKPPFSPSRIVSDQTNDIPPLKVKPRRTQPAATERPSWDFKGLSAEGDGRNVQGGPDSVRGSGEDYYHSYYSTLIASPTHGQPLRRYASANSLNVEPVAKPISTTHHPYAYVLPITEVPETPSSAPVLPTPKLKFDDVPPSPMYHNPSRMVPRRPIESLSEGGPQLKGSVSTPNLRSAIRTSRLRKAPALPKGKDRWLSAETWCDALLFPRPRLKVKQDGEFTFGGSGRIVSPPGSPISPHFVQNPVEGVASRVLAHSRSLVDLNAPEAPNDRPGLWGHEEVGPPPPPPPKPPPNTKALNPRPRSFAWDDLALPSPIPSLSR